MKRKVVYALFYFFLSSHFLFSYSYEDYELYLKAKKEYQAKKYQEAYETLSLLKRTFPFSRVQRSKLLDYSLALTQSQLGEKEKAIQGLTTNVIPAYIEERDYLLGNLYMEEKKPEKANIYFQRLLSSEYTYSHEKIEKK